MFYGVSYAFEFGRWVYDPYCFDSQLAAERWLHRESYDFRTRELVSRTKAIKLCGLKRVKAAEADRDDYYYLYSAADRF